MSDELVEKLIDAQLRLTDKFCEVLDLLKLEMQSQILKDAHHAAQFAQNQSILSALQYKGDK